MLTHFNLPTIAPIGICIILFFIGLYQVNRRLKGLSEKKERIVQFLNNLKLFVESSGRNREAYFNMVHQSALVQSDIGSYGIMSYKPPGANYMIHNYQIVVNLLSEIDHWIHNDDVFRTMKPGRALVSTLQEALVRFLGVAEDIQRRIEKIKRNPLLLLREGISWLLSLPLSIFSFLGIINENIPDSVSQSGIIRFISGLLTLIGLVGSIVTIVIGWSAFIAIISTWL